MSLHPDALTNTIVIFGVTIAFILLTVTYLPRAFGDSPWTFAGEKIQNPVNYIPEGIYAVVLLLGFIHWCLISSFLSFAVVDDKYGTKYTTHNGSSSLYAYSTWVYNEQLSNMIRLYYDNTIFTAFWVVISGLSMKSKYEIRKQVRRSEVDSKLEKKDQNIVQPEETSALQKILEKPNIIIAKILDGLLPIVIALHVLNMMFYESNVYRKDLGTGEFSQPNSTLSRQKYVLSTVSDTFFLFMLLSAWIMFVVNACSNFIGFQLPTVDDTLFNRKKQFLGIQHMFVFGSINGNLWNSYYSEYMALCLIAFDFYHTTVFYMCPTQVFSWVICVPMVSVWFTMMNSHRNSFYHLYILTSVIWNHGHWVFRSFSHTMMTSADISKIMFGDHTYSYDKVGYLTNFYDTNMGCRPVLNSQQELQNLEVVLIGLASVKLVTLILWPLYTLYEKYITKISNVFSTTTTS